MATQHQEKASNEPTTATRTWIWVAASCGAIMDVDTAAGKFVGTINVALYWKMNEYEKKEYTLIEQEENNEKKMIAFLDSVPCPILVPQSAIDLTSETSQRPEPVHKSKEDKYRFIQSNSFRGTFEMDGDLKSFPFDVQSLKFRFRIDNTMCTNRNWVILDFNRGRKEDNITTSLFLIRTDAMKDKEFKLILAKVEAYEQIPNKEAKWYNSHIWFTLYVERLWQYYLHQVIIVTCCLALFVFPIFRLNVDAFNERVSYLVTLILAQVASLYVLNSHIPKLPYLTMLDIYIYGGFCFTLLAVIESLIVDILCDKSTSDVLKAAELVDRVAFYCFVGSFVIFHIWFVYKTKSIMRHNQQCIASKMTSKEVDIPKNVRTAKVHHSFKAEKDESIAISSLNFRDYQSQSLTF
eukprot:353371_1